MSRNTEIIRLRRECGMTLQAIGEKVGLTRARIRQILETGPSITERNGGMRKSAHTVMEILEKNWMDMADITKICVENGLRPDTKIPASVRLAAKEMGFRFVQKTVWKVVVRDPEFSS